MNRILISFFVFLLILVSCHKNASLSSNNLRYVKTYVIDTLPVYDIFEIPGKVVAAEEIELAFKQSGVLKKIYPIEGEFVGKGTLIAELDDKDYILQTKAVDSEFNQINSEAKRIISLYADSAVSSETYDKVRYGLEQIAIKRQIAYRRLEETKIYAPFDGYVQKKYFSPATVLGAGVPVVEMVSLAAPEIEIDVPISIYEMRDAFASCAVVLNTQPSEILSLKLVSISKKANRNQLYNMHFAIKEKNSNVLSLGMNVMVKITFRKNNMQRKIPATAIFYDNGKEYIWIYNSDSTVSRQRIEINRFQLDGTVVVNNDLQNGMRIITTGVNKLKEGDKVIPLPEKSETNVGGLL